MKKIQKRNDMNRKTLHQSIVQKNLNERNNFITNLDKYLAKKREESEIKKEQAFQKYQSYASKNYIII